MWHPAHVINQCTLDGLFLGAEKVPGDVFHARSGQSTGDGGLEILQDYTAGEEGRRVFLPELGALVADSATDIYVQDLVGVLRVGEGRQAVEDGVDGEPGEGGVSAEGHVRVEVL